MPWKPGQAQSHTKAASSSAKQRKWAAVANAALASKKDDAAAIRIANAAVRKTARRER